MQINYNIISIIEIFGLVQGIILGSFLLIINKHKTKQTSYLGLFILIYSLDFTSGILEDLNITDNFPSLVLLPLDFVWLQFPLFYIYIQKVSIFSNKKNTYWVLYPGIVSIIINIILFLLPIQTKYIIEDSFAYGIYQLVGYIYTLWIGYLTIKWINKHIKEVKSQFSSTKHKELRWGRLFVVIGFVFVIGSLILIEIIGAPFILVLTIAIINVILLYWISLRGILQYNIHSTTSKFLTEQSPSVEIISPINNEDLELLTNRLDNYLNTSEAFKLPELTIVELAQELKVHPRKLSKAINTICKKNFNDYINKYRIEKAKKFLTDEYKQKLTVEGIGQEVGFKSKSTFYHAFKKITGTTPSRYKKHN